MNDWTAGYLADVGYTHGYFHELNPLSQRFSFRRNGFVSPQVATACELGFGQGISTNIHAAASSVQWWGTDFSPQQAALAQELAGAAGAGAKLFDEAFADFVHRNDLPDFDFIALHGIWSWINDENRHHIVDFIRRKLKVGGVLMISYNALPGWASFLPIRHLMRQHVERAGPGGGAVVDRVDEALAFAEQVLGHAPAFGKACPAAGERLKTLKGRDSRYMAHEYFNLDWHPMHFATVAQWLAPAKLDYACQADLLEQLEHFNHTAEQLTFLNSVKDPVERETVRDLLLNQQFRRDYWVKGLRRSGSADRLEDLRRQRMVMVRPREGMPMVVKGPRGMSPLDETAYAPLLDLMADQQPHSLGEIERRLSLPLANVLLRMTMLAGGGHIGPTRDDEAPASVRASAARLNAHLLRRARSSGEIDVLASPLTGGGVGLARMSQLFLLAFTEGAAQPAALARGAWHWLSEQRQMLVREGRRLETPEANLAYLEELAQHFLSHELPALKAVQVA